jgi:uncharacterized Ntn-hydrolase superfamily protein
MACFGMLAVRPLASSAFAFVFVMTAVFSEPRGALASAAGPILRPEGEPVVATFSIVAFDPVTGDLGVAVQSKFFGVGTVVPFAKAGVGAIATQSYANIEYGPEALALLEQGKSPSEVMQQITEADSGRARRQVGIVDARGKVAAFTGAECHEWAGHIEGTNFCVQGNILAGKEVVEAMAGAFVGARSTEGTELADWLTSALAAGQAAGGDKRGQQSAALLVVRRNGGYDGKNDRFIDLRVEDHPKPIDELSRLLSIHKQFYKRAHNPPTARGNAGRQSN